ncbi:MAG: chloride channel protein, partial [Vicinamibacterales bacterium]
EGPSVQIGAGLASVIGRWVGLPAARVKELLPIGAAGALSAAFNTPVSAVIFALEEIIGDLNAALLGSTVVASVAAVIVERALLGNEPLFRVPTYELVHPFELLAYAGLGVVGGVVSLLFCKTLLRARRLFRELPPWSIVLQPALGGLIVGVILVFVPEVRGVGYEFVDQALNGGLVLRTLMVLGLVKLVATIVSYASGNAGGIFAPSLFIGAMTGGAVGTIVHAFAPFSTADPGAYALVGMGALFAGIIRAPMTSVFMIFEITQDYQILVPLMVANLLSFTISRQLQPVSVYHALLEQDGIHLPTFQPSDRGRQARDLMRLPGPFVADTATVREADALADREGASLLLVGSTTAIGGIVRRRRLADALAAGLADLSIATLVEPEFVHVHPDHAVDVVLDRLAESGGRLPVVRRDNVRHVVGVITMDSLTRSDSPPPSDVAAV